MTPEQCRAARGWLNWTQADLAKAANTALSTVKDYEGGRRTPMPNNLAAIQAALEKAGIAFVFAEGKIASGIAFKAPLEATPR
ncbi:helix-turn-helix domain-containing protein [Methylocapsa acidiphila]|uniref:helix-turn-helix domain-containing protein n=1 Tax=Methylocapsa acidiphila TaxID=133552 RepID=UPI00040E3DC8|nr:helix-turn-helix transcriptional regulator [Methylocapsa acidiphila]